MIRFRCVGCGHPVSVPDVLAGQLFVCPKCYARGKVPAASTDHGGGQGTAPRQPPSGDGGEG